MSDYAWTQFLSDIGGSAGLVLGLSFATIFGMIDFVVTMIFVNLKRLWRNGPSAVMRYIRQTNIHTRYMVRKVIKASIHQNIR